MISFFVYRDTKTGRYARCSTWKRSKTHGGGRYKRELYKRKRKPPVKLKRKRKLLPPPTKQTVMLQATYKARHSSTLQITIDVQPKYSFSTNSLVQALHQRIDTGRDRAGYRIQGIMWEVGDQTYLYAPGAETDKALKSARILLEEEATEYESKS